MELIEEKLSKARKNHTCDYCLSQINKGELYHNTRFIEDVFLTWKSHVDCQKVVDKYWDSFGEGATSGNFFELVEREYKGEQISFQEKIKILANGT